MRNITLSLSLIFAVILLLIPVLSEGQHQAGGIPLSFGRALKAGNVPTAEVSPPSAEAISKIESGPRFPLPFAINIPLDLTMVNSGNTEILSDGMRVWRLCIHSSSAHGLILYFDRFRLPANSRLFVYNSGRTELFGAYTSANNNSFGTFACPLVSGEALVLEYNAPATLALPEIHVSELAYAFREFGNNEAENPSTGAGKCEVNVKCQEGNNWEKQIRGVVKIVAKDSNNVSWLCSGSMINNTSNDGAPYLLTAYHCGIKSRAVDRTQWLFYFNYQMPGCPNTTAPNPGTLLGATLLSHGGAYDQTGSDFYLVKLNESIPDSFNVYFNGWSREDVSSPNGVGIHHPWGDVKKISTYTIPIQTSTYSGNPNPCYWMVFWHYTVSGHGVTEPGSSGSPLFNSSGQIVGTLTGGYSDCDTGSINLEDYYGKFSWHWDQNGTDSASVLKCWLDPNNTGATKMGGWALGVNSLAGNEASVKLFPNPARDYADISLENESLISDGVSINILDIVGNTVRTSAIGETSRGNYKLDLRSLSPGVYFVVISGGNYRKSLKLVKL